MRSGCLFELTLPQRLYTIRSQRGVIIMALVILNVAGIAFAAIAVAIIWKCGREEA